MELQLPRGTRDFPPEEKILRDEVIGTLTTVFERYGFNPIETPIIERYDVLSAKYGASDETDVMKETYRLQDQGGRELGLRYELTLSTARFVGMNPQLKMPFKRYQIGEVFRDGPIKLGRYRQFTQCDVDIFGCASMAADAEVIRLILDAYDALGIRARVVVNNRKLLNGLIERAGIAPEKRESVIITIDKLEKVGEEEVRKELEEKAVPDEAIAQLLSSFKVQGSTEEKLAVLAELIGVNEGLAELRDLTGLIPDDRVIIEPSLARGLAYYTSTVFEGFFESGEIRSSICGGGRYDEMVGALLGGAQQVPAVGVAFGIEPITEQLKRERGLVRKSVADVYVAPIKCDAAAIVQQLRGAGIKTDLDIQGRGISKNLDYANSLGIPYALIVGPRELEQGMVKLRDMASGDEQELTVEETIRALARGSR